MPDFITGNDLKTLEAVQLLATYMHGHLTSGVPYASLGLPTMQHVIDLCDRNDTEATRYIFGVPELARLARSHGYKPAGALS